MHDDLKRLLKDMSISIMLGNMQYFSQYQPIVDYWKSIKDAKLAKDDLIRAMGLDYFLSTLVQSPLIWVIPAEKVFEYCLKAVLIYYKDSSLANTGEHNRQFNTFINSLNCDGFIHSPKV